MRSLLDGSVPVAQRAQLQKNYHISDQDLQGLGLGFAASGPSTASGSRPTTGQKRSRRRPLPPCPAHNRGSTGRGRGGGGGGGGSPGGSPGGGGGSPGGGGGRGGRRRLDQDGLRRQMDLLSQDTRQRTDVHRIRNMAHTNTVTTVYEDGGTPTVRCTPSRISNPLPLKEMSERVNPSLFPPCPEPDDVDDSDDGHNVDVVYWLSWEKPWRPVTNWEKTKSIKEWEPRVLEVTTIPPLITV